MASIADRYRGATVMPDFLDDIIEWSKRPEVSLILKLTVKALIILANLFPEPARSIMQLVLGFFDKFDAQAAKGVNVPLPEKRAATETVVTQTLAEYHGSGSLLSESWVRAMTALFVDVLGSMRYGEDFAKLEQAQIKGYASTSEDLQNAAKTHAALQLFGV